MFGASKNSGGPGGRGTPVTLTKSPDLHDYYKCDRSTLGCQDPRTLACPPPPQSEKVVIVLKDIDYRRTRADTRLVACYDLWSGKGMGLFLTYPRDTLRTGPFLFQTRGRNRRPNVALVFVLFILCCSIWRPIYKYGTMFDTNV